MQVLIFFITTGDADRTTAFNLRNLAHGRPYGAGCARNNYRLAFPRLADVEQTKVGGQARHPENAESGGNRDCWKDFHQTIRLHDVVKSPAKHASHDISVLKPG